MSEANIAGDTGSTSQARTEPRHLRRVVVIWAVLSVIGVVVWLAVAQFVVPPTITQVGIFDTTTIILFTALAVPVAMFVWVFLGYSLANFRVKERPTGAAVNIQPRPAAQIGWLSITGGLCLFLVIWGLIGLYQETTVAADAPLVVQVTGQQWGWTFDYPQYGASSQAQVLELPVNRQVVFQVTSKDVLHGFAIIAMGVRVDANPGQMINTPPVTPTQTGSYTVVCVELCGLYHTYMWSAVDVVSSQAFNAWIISQGGHV